MNKYLNLTKERDDWSKAMAQVPQEEFINFEEWIMKAQDRKSRKKQLEQLEKEGLLRHDAKIVAEQTGRGFVNLSICREDCRACAKLREVRL